MTVKYKDLEELIISNLEMQKKHSGYEEMVAAVGELLGRDVRGVLENHAGRLIEYWKQHRKIHKGEWLLFQLDTCFLVRRMLEELADEFEGDLDRLFPSAEDGNDYDEDNDDWF